jgi:hypothetical protein
VFQFPRYYLRGVFLVVGAIADVANGLETLVEGALLGQRIVGKAFQLDASGEVLERGLV